MHRVFRSAALLALASTAPLDAQDGSSSSASGGAAVVRAAPAAAPREAREYDWSRGLLLSQVALPRFNTARIVISGLNPVCFDYRTELETQLVEIPSTSALASLLGVERAAEDADDAGDADGAETSTTALAALLGLAPESADPAAGPAARNNLPAEAEAMRQRLIAAGEALAEAEASIGAANARVSRAGADAEEIRGSACKPVPFRNVLDAWTAAYARNTHGLATARRELDAARAGIGEARRRVGEASLLEHRLLRNAVYAANRNKPDSFSGALARQLDAAKLRVESLEDDRSTAEESLLKMSGALEQANSGMRAAEMQSVLYFDVRPGLLDGEYKVKLTATEHAQPDKEPSRPQESSFTIPIDRTFRILMSAGFAFSPVRAPIYGRSNRPVPDSAGKTYSTFDAIDREELAYAPLLQANALLTRLGPLPVGVSFGAAAREVNDKKGIDFLAGFTASLQDHLFFTVGLYNARREYLRLGDPEEVRGKAVPESVSDADAVGVERKSSFGFSFSFKN